MCGIIGIATSEGVAKGWMNRRDYMKEGLYADALRGMHSTGLMMVPSNETSDVVIHKRAMCSTDFLDLGTTDKYLQNIDKYRFVIGHNRHATRGSISNKMAHPFNHGKITLVHNGTLFTQSYLPNGLSFTSDSECITNALNELSSDEVIPQLDGAFALIWHDDSDDTLHMVRNNERPLTFALVKDQDTMLIASEAKMLEWLAERNSMTIETVYEPGPGHELIFQKNNFAEYASKQHKLFKKKVYSQSNNIYSGHGYVGGDMYDGYPGYGSNTNYPAKNKGADGRKKFKSKGKRIVLLKDLGLARGQREELVVEKFVPYNTSVSRDTSIGYLECVISDLNDDHVVMIYGVRAVEWDWAEGGMITAVIQSAFLDTEDNDDSLVTVIATDPLVSLNNHVEKPDDDTSDGDTDNVEATPEKK